MGTLWDNVSPKPGQRCPCCGLIVPELPALRAGKKHPETSHDAAAVARLRQKSRTIAVLELLAEAGEYGATDDEIDARLGYGHQCTTPIMWALRKARIVGWKNTAANMPVKRPTRKGNDARVNVLAEYAIHAAATPEDDEGDPVEVS